MSSLTPITKESFKNLKDQVVFIDFWASWCGPCKAMDPIIEEKIVPLFKDITFCAVNTDEQPELSEQFGIRSIPTMFLIKFDKDGNQKIIETFRGVTAAFDMATRMTQSLEKEGMSADPAAA